MSSPTRLECLPLGPSKRPPGSATIHLWSKAFVNASRTIWFVIVACACGLRVEVRGVRRRARGREGFAAAMAYACALRCEGGLCVMAGAARRRGARASLLPSWARGDGVNAGAGAHLFYLPDGFELDSKRRVVAFQVRRGH